MTNHEWRVHPDDAHPRLEPNSLFDIRSSNFNRAFTLLEVMIAMGLFFMAVFSILALVSNGLRNARALQQTTVDTGMLAAELSLTNKLTEGTDSGDFGDLYPDYKWTQEITEVGTNGLFEVKFMIIHRTGNRFVETPMNILLFRPDSIRR
jgi:hypothetical protein